MMNQRVYKQSLAQLPDLTAVKNLYCHCEQYDGYPIKNYWHILQERAKDYQAFDFFCLIDQQVIGVTNTFFFDQTVELVVYVHPDHRRQGIAKKLIQIALAKLRQYIVPSYSFIVAQQSVGLIEKCRDIGGQYHHTEVEMHAPAELPVLNLPSVTLRQATVDDVYELARIHEYSFNQSNRQQMAQRFTDALKESWRKIWLMYDAHDQLVGKLHWREDFNRIVLHDIGILPEFRQKNYGKALMINWLQQFGDKPDKPLVVEVLGDNTAALKLYESCSFYYTNHYQFWRFDFK